MLFVTMKMDLNNNVRITAGTYFILNIKLAFSFSCAKRE